MFLVRPIPWSDESSSGVLMRAACQNGWENVGVWLSAIGASNIEMTVSESRLRTFFKFARRYGVDMSKFEQASNNGGRPRRRLRYVNASLSLPLKVFRPECSTICPECLKENCYIRSLWSIRFYTTCHLHERQLLDTCPSCSSRLDWMRPALDKCSCGYDLGMAWGRKCDSAGAIQILKMMEDENKGAIDNIVSVFSAFSDMAEESPGVQNDEELLQAYLGGEFSLVAFLRSKVAEQIDHVHPRLTLLAFLKEDQYAKEIALEVLISLNALKLPRTSDQEISGSLNGMDSALALGVSHSRLLIDLRDRYLTMADQDEDIGKEVRYTRASIDSLLRKLHVPSSEEAIAARNRALTEPLAKVICDLIDNPSFSGGYYLEDGISGLRKIAVARPLNVDLAAGVFMTLEQAANLLSVHYEVVRSLIKRGYFNAVRANDGTRTLCISTAEVIAFNDLYVFAGALAREVGASPTKFSEKLFSFGIAPRGGPHIDGLLVYLIRRADIIDLDLTKVKFAPPHSLWRKKNDKNRKMSAAWMESLFSPKSLLLHTVPIAKIAADLQLNIPQVLRLIKAGLLTQMTTAESVVSVTKCSYQSCQKLLNDESLISLEEAAKRLNESTTEFLSRWCSTGAVKLVDLGIRRSIPIQDIERIEKFKKAYITARDAGRMVFSKGRYHLPNLERQGLIESWTLGGKRKTRMYSREDVERLWLEHCRREKVDLGKY
jgi:excisionase family DNA binding protein